MEYDSTTGVILYWNPESPHSINGNYNACFDEYKSKTTYTYNKNTGCILQNHNYLGIHKKSTISTIYPPVT